VKGMATPTPQDDLPQEPADNDWLDVSQVPVLREGQPEQSVLVHHPALVDFGEDAMRIVATLCELAGFAGSRPWGFLAKQASLPVKHLVLKPLEVKDIRGVPLVQESGGNGYRLNLRAVYQAYHIETYKHVNCRVTLQIDDRIPGKPTLLYLYGQQTLESISRRNKRRKEPPTNQA